MTDDINCGLQTGPFVYLPMRVHVASSMKISTETYHVFSFLCWAVTCERVDLSIWKSMPEGKHTKIIIIIFSYFWARVQKWFEIGRNSKGKMKKRSNVIVFTSLQCRRSIDWRISRQCHALNFEKCGFVRHFFGKERSPAKLVRFVVFQSSALFSSNISFYSIRFTRASTSHPPLSPSLSNSLFSSPVRLVPCVLFHSASIRTQTTPLAHIFILLCLLIEFTLFSCSLPLSLHVFAATPNRQLLSAAVCESLFSSLISQNRNKSHFNLLAMRFSKAWHGMTHRHSRAHTHRFTSGGVGSSVLSSRRTFLFKSWATTDSRAIWWGAVSRLHRDAVQNEKCMPQMKHGTLELKSENLFFHFVAAASAAASATMRQIEKTPK